MENPKCEDRQWDGRMADGKNSQMMGFIKLSPRVFLCCVRIQLSAAGEVGLVEVGLWCNAIGYFPWPKRTEVDDDDADEFGKCGQSDLNASNLGVC